MTFQLCLDLQALSWGCLTSELWVFLHFSFLFPFFWRKVFHMDRDVPPPMSGTCSCYMNGHMYIFGGCDDNGQTNQVWLISEWLLMTHVFFVNIVMFTLCECLRFSKHSRCFLSLCKICRDSVLKIMYILCFLCPWSVAGSIDRLKITL